VSSLHEIPITGAVKTPCQAVKPEVNDVYFLTVVTCETAVVIQGFSHIGICVTNLDRSVRFYTNVFGFAQLYQLDFENNEVAATMELDGTFRSAMLIRGDIRIELLQWVDVPITGSGQRKPMNELGFTHLSFRVEDVDGLTAAIIAAGGTVVEQTRTVLGEATDPAAPRFIYLTDPDGTRIELMQNVPDLSGMGTAPNS
jgi:glyoxylase I family protein